jgi:dTDP-4-amino-4,6-dideoxygalactose transaminase/nucleoside-diphosphate-sugar epimerase
MLRPGKTTRNHCVPGPNESDHRSDRRSFVVVGGAGFAGRHLSASLAAAGHDVTVVDRRPPPREVVEAGVEWVDADVLEEVPSLPSGEILLAVGTSDPRPAHPWTLVLDNALTTARLLPALADRSVTLLSSIEVYGPAAGPLTEDTPLQLWVDDDRLADWCSRAVELAHRPCTPASAAELCRELVDPGGRWTYAASKRAQEVLLAAAAPAGDLTVLRLANLFGPGQDRVIARLARRCLAGLPLHVTNGSRSFLPVAELTRIVLARPGPGTWVAGGPSVRLLDLAHWVSADLAVSADIHRRDPVGEDSCGMVDAARLAARIGRPGLLRESVRTFVRGLAADGGPLASPPLPVVVPPRPFRPDVVVARTAEVLWNGQLKHGNRWTTELTHRLGELLELPDDRTVLLTTSGTTALRLAVVATAGPADPGDVAVLPSFTFAATADVLAQLGYRLVFCDVDPATWTLDPNHLSALLAEAPVKVVVAVDALGLPSDYKTLVDRCRAAGVPLVADSAAALGARHQGRPVGVQADAHAYSMSFAKVVSAGGAGGAVVVRRDRVAVLDGPVHWLRSALMPEPSAIAALDLVERLPDLLARRTAVAAVYQELADARVMLQAQELRPGDRHALVHWVACVGWSGDGRRDRVAAALAARGIQTKPYYAPALHRLRWPESRSMPDAALPVTSKIVDTALALPLSSELTVEQAELVVAGLDRALRQVDGVGSVLSSSRGDGR